MILSQRDCEVSISLKTVAWRLEGNECAVPFGRCPLSRIIGSYSLRQVPGEAHGKDYSNDSRGF